MGFGENRSGYRARAGALTVVWLASDEERETLCRLLAQVEGRLFDPDADPDAPLLGEEPPDAEGLGEAEAAAFEDEPFPDPDLVAAPGAVPEAEASGEGSELDPDAPMRATPAGDEVFVLAQVLEAWLGVQMPGDGLSLAGANARVEAGRVVSAEPELEPSPENYATGSPLGWMETVIDPSAGKVSVGGDERLGHALIDGLHRELFGGPFPTPEEMLGGR